MILTLSGKYSLVLVVCGHDINFCVPIKIIQPIGTDAGRYKRNLPVFAQLRKYSLANVLISKCNEFFPEILIHFIQHNLYIVQFQFAFVRINITKPETDKKV